MKCPYCHTDVTIPPDALITTCTRCGAMAWMTPEDTVVFEPALPCAELAHQRGAQWLDENFMELAFVASERGTTVDRTAREAAQLVAQREYDIPSALWFRVGVSRAMRTILKMLGG